MMLAGAAARLIPLTANRFHPDEALFATLARLISSGQDPMLAHTALLVDKPPLFYYTIVLAVISFGGREIAFRMPGEILSILSMALTVRLSWRLWRSWPATLVTAVLVALSPFAILFSPTVFSDPQYVFWLLLAMVAAAEGRWWWAGLLGGLALASKQSAAFFLPLVGLIGLSQGIAVDRDIRSIFRRLAWFGAGVGLALIAVVVWDRLRAPAVSFWTAAVDANNPGRLVRSDEVWPRSGAWLGWGSALTGSAIGNLMVCTLAGAAAPMDAVLHPGSRRSAGTLLLAAGLAAYAAVLWLVAFPLLDRYLLPAIYLVALLAGRGADLILEVAQKHANWMTVRRWLAPAGLAALLVSILPGAVQAAQNGIAVGGDHGANAGIDRAAAYLSARPMGTVVYAHDMSWMLDFYLFDVYVYHAYFLGPESLASDLRAFGESSDERYIVLSGAEGAEEIGQAVAGAGYRLTPIGLGSGVHIRLFRLERIP